MLRLVYQTTITLLPVNGQMAQDLRIDIGSDRDMSLTEFIALFHCQMQCQLVRVAPTIVLFYCD